MGCDNSSSLQTGYREVTMTWGCLAFVVSIVGNTVVLVASVRHKAIKLDRISIVLLENLAVADIGLSLIHI